VVMSVLLLDKLKLDDPVGAVSVHLVCGVWGTLAVGIFSTNPEQTLTAQLIGVAAAGATCFTAAFAIFAFLKAVMGIRVHETEELRGLDVGEHGMEAYGGFQVFTTL